MHATNKIHNMIKWARYSALTKEAANSHGKGKLDSAFTLAVHKMLASNPKTKKK